MPGMIYFVQADIVNLIKIGWSREPDRRLTHLQIGSPVKLTMLAAIPGHRSREKKLHYQFHAHRSHGEWFFPAQEILAYIELANTNTNPSRARPSAHKHKLHGRIPRKMPYTTTLTTKNTAWT
jgi:hypothetical protein